MTLLGVYYLAQRKMKSTVAQKCLLRQIVETLSFRDDDTDSYITDDIDCTELVCSFIFDGDFIHRHSPFSSPMKNPPKDSERLKKIRVDYPQKVANNKNTGKRSINKTATYLVKPSVDTQCDQIHQKMTTDDDDDDSDDEEEHRFVYNDSMGIVKPVIIEKLCTEIGWMCILMGYSRSMIQRINFSVMNQDYRNSSGDIQQIIIMSQTILVM